MLFLFYTLEDSRPAVDTDKGLVINAFDCLYKHNDREKLTLESSRDFERLSKDFILDNNCSNFGRLLDCG